jgi:hypothetical protein
MKYDIAGLGATSDLDIIAGFDLMKSLRTIGKGVERVAPAALPFASFIPGVGPAAIAATAALRVAQAARHGHPPARVAMNMLGKRADLGDPTAQRWVALFNQAVPMLDAQQIRQLALLARRGDSDAQGALQTLASAADLGEPRAQRAFESAAGTYHIGDEEIGDEDVVDAGSILGQLKPHRGFLPDSEFFTTRDAYYEGLRVLRKEADAVAKPVAAKPMRALPKPKKRR